MEKKYVRLIYADAQNIRVASAVENPTAVFAVLGPFENFSDKLDLQQDLENLLRKYNSKNR